MCRPGSDVWSTGSCVDQRVTQGGGPATSTQADRFRLPGTGSDLRRDPRQLLEEPRLLPPRRLAIRRFAFCAEIRNLLLSWDTGGGLHSLFGNQSLAYQPVAVRARHSQRLGTNSSVIRRGSG
jgi:hypothetical protein